jgi:TPR repeat protein
MGKASRKKKGADKKAVQSAPITSAGRRAVPEPGGGNGCKVRDDAETPFASEQSMAGPTQFRQYLIAQDAEGSNVEVVRTAEQVGVLAFDTQRMAFVHCHVLLDQLSNRRAFDDRAKKIKAAGHPSLARLIESGEDEGSAFYITANADGETLRSYLSRHEQLPVWLAMRLACQALKTVRALLEVGDFLPLQLMEAMRIVQTGAHEFRVVLGDYRLADPPGAKSAKARLAKTAFEKQEQFLGVFFLERLQTGPSMQEATLGTTDFAELLENLLSSCGQHVEGGIDKVIKALEKSAPAPPPGEMAAQLKPRPLVAPLLPGFSEVARSVSTQVRIHSQKLDPSQPYAMRGTLTKTGQEVVVEQVPPARMVGLTPASAMRQELTLPKTGKYPNLVPVNFVDPGEGLVCMAETAVEGLALSELLVARGTLDPQETYLVLAGMDAALAQLEKTALETRRLRLEDIFLFTGFSKGPVNESGLLSRKLNEWPGFSIVLRAHPCLSAMSGRGTDPALLLPVELKAAKGDAEPVWHGAWMAALGCFLSGMTSGEAAKHTTGVEEVDATHRMFEDELTRGRKGSPSSRPAFLARYARVIQHHDLAQPEKVGGFWAELSGAGAAQGRASEIARTESSPAPAETKAQTPAMEKVTGPIALPLQDKPSIGFAEALIQQPRFGNEGDEDDEEASPRGLRTMRAGMRAYHRAEEFESSWRPMHEATPMWVRGLLFAGGSLLLGAALAHLSGRAMWQTAQAPSAARAIPAESAPPPIIDLPVAPPVSQPPQSASTPKSKSGVTSEPKLSPPPPNQLAAADLDPKLDVRPAGLPGTSAAAASSSSSPGAIAGAVDPALTEKLIELRKTGARLPADLRTAADKAARSGSTEAMLALGRMHLRGETGSVDERTAFTWFDKAMNAGDAAATVPLAECYLQGWGTAPDLELAVDLLKKAATTGDATAKDLLGVCYARGIGVERDDAKAYALCSEAYASGSVTACGNLGAMFLRGQGVTQDAGRAVQLFAEGARRGHADSMLLYAQSLEYGTGVPANPAQATQWYVQSARLGNAEAASWCRQKGIAY